jgi:aldehyde:ferredoxin oxidoreductase
MHGVHGRLLHVDLSSRTCDSVLVPEIVSQRLLGGIGLASYLLCRLCPAGIDPFSRKSAHLLLQPLHRYGNHHGE